MAKKKTSGISVAKTVEAPVIEENVHPRIAFIKSVKFAGLGLDKAESFINRELFTKSQDQEPKPTIDLSLTHEVLVHRDTYFTVLCKFGLKQRELKSQQPAISISAEFSARFNLSSPAEADFVQAFAMLEARLIFFPYIRHFVSDTTYRMSIDPVVLPMTSELE